MTVPKPIAKGEFAGLLKRLGISPKDGPFAVAVSGGADSMALSLLMADFAPSYFLTFDHGLRADSKKEGQTVHTWLKEKGLGHAILTWQGKKPKTGIEEKARAARYQALEGWCSNHNVRFLLTAHQLEDQAETFLMRLLKGSGLDGLAAMAPKGRGLFEGDVQILRPLLGIPRQRLKATLKAKGQAWFDDPMNENPDFTRVKVRKLLNETKTLKPAFLADMANRFGQIRWFLEETAARVLKRDLTIHEAGFATLEKKAFKNIPAPIARRVLGIITGYIGQAGYPPAGEKLERLYKGMSEGGFSGVTLSGCRIVPQGSEFLFCREAGKIKARAALEKNKKVFWDNRFEMELKGSQNNLFVQPLTEKGWENLAGKFPKVKEIGLPHPVRASLPAIYRGNKVICVPHLNFNPEKLRVMVKFAPKRAIS